MGVLDKFLDIMKLSDDDDYYDDDDFFDDDYDDDYDDRPAKKSLFGRSRKDRYDDEDDDYDVRDRDRERDRDSKPSRKQMPAVSSSKITPMRQPSRRNASVSMEVCVIKPASVEDAREISETLLSGRTVILNLEGLDLEIAQRIIDFTSGSTFAIDGNLQKISNYIFLVTPTNVDISGDLQNLLGSSIDASPIGGGY
ncbi:MAG: cell division protein SepF [Dorea sp.]|nr:cell division protein SepF [Dorea sp.]